MISKLTSTLLIAIVSLLWTASYSQSKDFEEGTSGFHSWPTYLGDY